MINKKIYKEHIFFSCLYLLGILILNPTTFINVLYPVLYLPFKICTLLIFIILLWNFLFGMKITSIKCVNVVFILSCIYIINVYLLSLLLKNYPIRINDTIRHLALILLFYVGYNKHRKHFLAGTSVYFIFFAIVMVILQLLYPNGINDYYYIFENKNYLVRFYLPGLCIVLLNSLKNKRSIISTASVFYTILYIIIILYTGSVTSLIGTLVFICLLILMKKGKHPRALNVDCFSIYSICIFIGIQFFGIQVYFEHYIVDYFHKDLTFHGRDVIWSAAIESIKKNPIFGIGDSVGVPQALLGFPHAHQYWLHILLIGGINGFGLILTLYILTGKRIIKVYNELDVIVMIATIDAFLMMGIDEALAHADLLLPLLVILYQKGLDYSSNKTQRQYVSLNTY